MERLTVMHDLALGKGIIVLGTMGVTYLGVSDMGLEWFKEISAMGLAGFFAYWVTTQLSKRIDKLSEVIEELVKIHRED